LEKEISGRDNGSTLSQGPAGKDHHTLEGPLKW